MLKVLIIDDEPLVHEVIISFSKEFPELLVINQNNVGLTALDYLNIEYVDIVFLDIEMPRLMALDFLTAQKHKPQVIITSSNADYVLDGLNINVVDYLFKPLDFERFQHAMKTAITAALEAEFAMQGQENQVIVSAGANSKKVLFDDIRWLEVHNKQLSIHLATEKVESEYTLNELENKLPKDKFLRIHKSVLVNRTFIDSISKENVTLVDGKVLPIGKKYQESLRT